jgi:hypothetical protein
VHQPQPQNDRESRRYPPPGGARSFAMLIGATALLYSLGLGSLDLWAPDEPHYAAVAEELRSFRHGLDGLALLHLNDAPYTQKPPLYFWLAALFGMSPTEGAPGYYGERGVASLRSETDLRTFLETGGRVALLRERDLDALGADLGLVATLAFRSGRRRLFLTVLADTAIPGG